MLAGHSISPTTRLEYEHSPTSPPPPRRHPKAHLSSHHHQQHQQQQATLHFLLISPPPLPPPHPTPTPSWESGPVWTINPSPSPQPYRYICEFPPPSASYFFFAECYMVNTQVYRMYSLNPEVRFLVATSAGPVFLARWCPLLVSLTELCTQQASSS